MADHPALSLVGYHSDGTIHDAFVLDSPEQAFESLMDHYHYSLEHDGGWWTLVYGTVVVASSKRRWPEARAAKERNG